MLILMHEDYPIGVYTSEAAAKVAWEIYVKTHREYFYGAEQTVQYCRIVGPFPVDGPAG